MAIFNVNKKSHKTRNMFFDGPVDIARYEDVKYPQIDKFTDKQMGFFWRPEEVDLLRDAKDFKEFTDAEKHIFTSNLKRQILLDSIQGRAPNLTLLPIVSLPELETWIETWSFFETIHSRSYTHIIRNIYSNPSGVFDTMLDIPEIVDCAKDIAVYYDILEQAARTYAETGKASTPEKVALWNALMMVNALEGIRFYVSFACTWAFAELKKVEGSAKIIKFICRDENVHLGSTTTMLRLLPQEDKDFEKIKTVTQQSSLEIYKEVVEQEKAWADYLFKDGSMIGLNADVLKQYIEWIAAKRCSAIGLPHDFKGGSNPLPWTQKWISGGDVQVAPQETEITSYVVGGVVKDVEENTFEGFKL